MTVDPNWDQALAAFAEAARLTDTLPGIVLIKNTPITVRVLAKWARGGPFKHGVVMHDLGYLPDGRRGSSADWTACDHLPTPQVCYGLANVPGHLMCGGCLMLTAKQSPNDCDWCGVSPQTDDRIKLYPSAYAIGPAIVVLALCDYHVTTPDYSEDSDWPRHLRNTL